jgi:spore coat polysaccharide biosynthesis protein SpsF
MDSGPPIAFVVARMSSARLPGKSLTPLGNDVLLGHVTSAIKQCTNISKIVVVTSTDPSDNKIVDWCRSRGLAVTRGSLQNVAKRVLEAAQEYRAGAFVRISGDSPLIDPRLIDYAVGVFRSHDYDVVTNVFPRTFPSGQSVEVVRTASLAAAYSGGLTTFEEEHVTQVFYQHPERFDIRNFDVAELAVLSNMTWVAERVHLAVDDPIDLTRCEYVIRALEPIRPWDAGWLECCQIAMEMRDCHE